ncbi:MAG TPA: MFS transporter, partial [Edaphobacter sp.]|nr:MFS transporter [Edaphobacter sp.]
MTANTSSKIRYGRYLIFIAGIGGLLYGIDIGIIAAALLYLGKTVSLTVEQTSLIVAAVLGGGMLSSLVAGVLADYFGRKKMMIVSGLMFVSSVGLIVVSQGFVSLFSGRLLQGMSGGVIAVVVPLYLAECLTANRRGQGTAIFQFMLTFGIVIAALIGLFYTHQAEAGIAAAAGNAALIRAAENHAWRGMFLSVIYPGVIFFFGSFFLSETPRWLFRKGRKEEALVSLLRSSSDEEAKLQMEEMEMLAAENARKKSVSHGSDSIFQKKYVIPFLLACVILACNQTTGINSILGFLVIILKQAGMTASHASQGDVLVKVLNCAMTMVAVALVDRKGRKFLLRIGTGGIVVALVAGGLIFHSFESRRIDLKSTVQSAVVGNSLSLPFSAMESPGSSHSGAPAIITVLYSYDSGDKMVTARSDQESALTIQPEGSEAKSPLVIKRAVYGSVPPQTTGWLITICLSLFIACYAMGPGVVVWLALTELLPTRIRSSGMGV